MLFLAGFLAGACLWALGWSSGGHLFEVPADDPGRTHAQAAAILALAGLAIGALPRGLDGRRSSTPLVLGLTLGLAAVGITLPDWIDVVSELAFRSVFWLAFAGVTWVVVEAAVEESAEGRPVELRAILAALVQQTLKQAG